MKKNEELKNNRYHERILRSRFKYQVPLWFCVQYNLNTLDVCLFAIVHNATLNAKNRCYCGSIEGLCSLVNACKPTIRTSLERLYLLGFIDKQIKTLKDRNDQDKNWVCYISRIDFNDTLSIDEQLDRELARREAMNIMNIPYLNRRPKKETK